MHALIFDGDRAAIVRNAPDPPAPPPGYVGLRVIAAGVGRLDLDICAGRWPYRGVLGREMVGVVQAAGEGVELTPGRRVVVDPVIACGACDLCTAGLGPHCRERSILGLHNADGCLAERVLLPARNVLTVPDAVDDDHAIFAVPLAEALQVRRLLTIEGAPFVTVLGSGVRSLLVAQILARMNASVRLVGRDRALLGLCERWNVKHRHADEIGRRADQDIVIDCANDGDGFDLATALVRPRGTIVTKSLAPSRAVELGPVVSGELVVRGAFGGPLSEALAVLARREVDVVSLIGRRIGLEDGVHALELAGQPGMTRVIVAP